MVTNIMTYLVALIVFFTIDMLWLGLIAKKLYRSQLGFLMRDKPNWPAAIIFYLIFVLGIVFFVVGPAIDNNSWSGAFIVGLIYGFITYVTYDLTNLATLKDWPIKITIIDILWGTSLGGMVSLTTYVIMSII